MGVGNALPVLHGRTRNGRGSTVYSPPPDGASGALVVRGEPGIGKMALLDHAVTTAAEMQVIRGQGIQSEGELPFAGLHLLLHTILSRAEGLPGPQRRALLGAFGLASSEQRSRADVAV